MVDEAASPVRANPFGGSAVHGGDVWGASRRLGRPVEDILDLSASLNPLGPPPGMMEDLGQSLGQVCYYPDRNTYELRETLAATLGLSPANLLPGNGSTALIRLVAQAMNMKSIVLVAPAFAEFGRSLAIAGRHFRYHFLQQDRGFAPEEGEFDEIWSAGPSCLIVSNPLVPTGQLLNIPVLDGLLTQARRHRSWLVVDEAFMDFVQDQELRAWAPARIKEYSKLLVLRSLTKFFCLAGLRLGYLVAHQDTIASLAPQGLPWAVNTLAQRAGVFCLGQDGYAEFTREQVAAWRKEMAAGLEGLGFSVYPGQVNFLAAALPPGAPGCGRVSAGLEAQGILVRDCSSFAGVAGGYLRFGVCPPADQKRLFHGLTEVLA